MLLEDINNTSTVFASIENDPTGALRTLQLAIEVSTHELASSATIWEIVTWQPRCAKARCAYGPIT